MLFTLFIIIVCAIIGFVIGHFIGENTSSATVYIVAPVTAACIGVIIGALGCAIYDYQFPKTSTVQIKEYTLNGNGIQYIEENGNVETLNSRDIKIINTEDEQLSIEYIYGTFYGTLFGQDTWGRVQKITIYD